MNPQTPEAASAILLLDNYDSFTNNLEHLLRTVVPWSPITVRRNDALTVDEALDLDPALLVISPGPGRPEESGITLPLIHRWPPERGLLGVCLGHQALGMACGARLRRHTPGHGKTVALEHGDRGLFAGLPRPFAVMRYHSLVLDQIPPILEVTAWAADEPGLVLGIRHRERPWEGIQFHPESYRTEHGADLIHGFLRRCPGRWRFPTRL